MQLAARNADEKGSKSSRPARGIGHHVSASPGVGKTHLAVAIGRQAILAGYTVLFVPAPTLVAQLAKAHSEGRLEDRLT
ncbi:MAG: ATP-binding protein, partial [Alphaproteobacteria bacterium]|nr:ATP-binding protein [Alphaproteobacteria bacterium]